MSRPVVAIVCDSGTAGGLPVQQTMDKYVAPVVECLGAVPWLVPVVSSDLVADVLDRVDGVLLPGGWSNLEPTHYGVAESYPGCLHDPARDAVSLRLGKEAIQRGIPVFGICRGLQELNVAYGGSLHQRIWDLEWARSHVDAGEDHGEEVDPYGPRHDVTVTPGGFLAPIVNSPSIAVNSLHGQAIDRLAPGLTIEAVAPDGIIEAISVDDATAFALAVQWHPEWQYHATDHYLAVFEAFGDAVRQRSGALR